MRRKTNRRRTLLTMQGLEERSLLTTLIALVDTGIDLTPSDTSYVNDSPYYDLADAYNAYDGSTNVGDNNGHGTALTDATVAGIKAATSQAGAAGASVKILPIRDTNSSGQLDINSIINGICYAADKGAAVINLSFAAANDFVASSQDTLHPNMSLSQAIRYAQTKGSVVVVAAGNNGNVIGGHQYGNQDIDIESPFPVEPAAMGYDAGLVNEIVTASFNTTTDALQTDSNYGPVHVSVATPGSETSFAAGYLSGVAGVIAAVRPDFTYSQIINRLDSTVQPVAALQGLVATGGVVSPANAINGLVSSGGSASGTASPSTVTGTTTVLSAQAAGLGSGASYTYQWQTTSEPAGAASPTFSANGSAAAATTTATFFDAGQYTFTVTVSGGTGGSATATVSTTVVQTLSSISVVPGSASLVAGSTTNFTASAADQFNNALGTQPAFTWSVTGSAGGTISPNGVYAAPAAGSGTDTVTASAGGISKTANVTVAPAPPPANLGVQALGQDGVDLVGNGLNSAQPDGYQDIDLLLTGIPATQTISYVDVFGYGGGEWQYNPQNGPHPHGSDAAALVRMPGASSAHLYVSPYMNETGRSYEVVVYLSGGSHTELYTGPVYANHQLPKLSVQSLGQDGVDLVGSGLNSAHPDGYQDIDLLLTGIPSAQTISYVDVFGYGGGEWQYNPQNGPHPHGSDAAALVTTSGATTAHLYVQPYQDEAGRSYEVLVYYASGASFEVYTGPVFGKAKLSVS
ncbi:MAG: S8 family serine peptidase [Isosphaeraceae bacterium]|nr:S8 family serine peptidase [Isosphaeraceae bacterium]